MKKECLFFCFPAIPLRHFLVWAHGYYRLPRPGLFLPSTALAQYLTGITVYRRIPSALLINLTLNSCPR